MTCMRGTVIVLIFGYKYETCICMSYVVNFLLMNTTKFILSKLFVAYLTKLALTQTCSM
jgi:hypothetical protein